MAEANKELHKPHFFDKLLRRGKKKDKAKPKADDDTPSKPPYPGYTEVGLDVKSYRPHDVSTWVSLDMIPAWNRYFTSQDTKEIGVDSQALTIDQQMSRKVSIYVGDITLLQVDAIVNSASPDLISLGAVGRSIHLAAGIELASTCAREARKGYCSLGRNVVTDGYKLPAKYVVHAVGPRGEKENVLRNCYRNCLKLSQDAPIRTIAFPCISTLYCGYGIRKAAHVVVKTVRDWLLEGDNMNQIDRIIFCVIDDVNKQAYEQSLMQYFPVHNNDTVPYEISQDPIALAQYEKAIKEGTEIDRVIRVNIVGNFGQGKTSLKRRLVYQNLEGVESTDSIDIDRFKLAKTTDGEIVCLQTPEDEHKEYIDRIVEVTLGNTEDNEEVDDVGEELYDEIDGLHVIDSDSDFEASGESDYVDGFPGAVAPNEMISEASPGLLEKPKEPVRALSKEEFASFTRELKSSNSRDSESKNIIDIWDFGGQFVYYATHTMFHSRQAIYLFVFDLSAGLDQVVRDEEFPGETNDKDMKYFVRFWLNSIHSFVGSDDSSLPVVILVGTHKDKLTGDVEQKCEEYFEKIRKLFEGTAAINHIHYRDFAVNNNDPKDTEVQELRKEILEIGQRLSKNIKIPAKWLPLEKALKEKKLDIIAFEEVMNINNSNEFPLSCLNQVKLFLQYHHSKGTLVYFDEERVCEYVVLNPQYLVDAFKCIITSERFCKKLPFVRYSWNKLVTEGILDDTLIDAVWDHCANRNIKDNKEILVEFLKKHHIISEAMQCDEESGQVKGLGKYIVPSLLKDHSNTVELAEFIEGRKQTECRFVMEFEHSALLHTIYSRVLAAVLGKWPVVHMPSNHRKVFLYENLGVFKVDTEHAGIVELRDHSIELLVVNLCPPRAVSSTVADRFRRYCEAVVQHMFRLLKSSVDNVEKPYKEAVRCNHESHGVSGSNLTESIATLKVDEVVPCPDLMKHSVCAEKVLEEWFLKDIEKVEEKSDTLNEKKLSNVAQAVGQNWQLLGTELGLSKVQIDHVNLNNDSAVRKIFDMLMTWKELNPTTATMNTLLQAIRNTVSLSVNWDMIRNIVDENKC